MLWLDNPFPGSLPEGTETLGLVRVVTRMTGQDSPPHSYRYAGTILLEEGSFMLHAYYVIDQVTP